jgi:hypothetical protein
MGQLEGIYILLIAKDSASHLSHVLHLAELDCKKVLESFEVQNHVLCADSLLKVKVHLADLTRNV